MKQILLSIVLASCGLAQTITDSNGDGACNALDVMAVVRGVVAGPCVSASSGAVTPPPTRTVGTCPFFQADYYFNSPINTLPLDPASAAEIATLGAGRLNPDPSFTVNLATNATPVPVFAWTPSAVEHDAGNYPLTPSFLVEGYPATMVSAARVGGADNHVLTVNTDPCLLYEIYALANSAPPYQAGIGAIWDLRDYRLRSAYKYVDPNFDSSGLDAGNLPGMPIAPLVFTHAEIYGSAPIPHAGRITLSPAVVGNYRVWPATHGRGSNGGTAIGVGQALRLKASFDIATCHNSDNSGKPFPANITRLLQAFQVYGLYNADFGASGLISTDADSAWGDPNSPTSDNWTFAGWLHCVPLSAFEVPDNSPRILNIFSGQVRTNWVR